LTWFNIVTVAFCASELKFSFSNVSKTIAIDGIILKLVIVMNLDHHQYN
jgi:hypothetical protein